MSEPAPDTHRPVDARSRLWRGLLRFIPLAAATVALVTVLAALSESVPITASRAFPTFSEGQSFALPLQSQVDGEVIEFRLTGQTYEIKNLENVRQIGLLLGTHHTTLLVREALLSLGDGESCTFSTGDTQLFDNTELALVASKPCVTPMDASTFKLVIRVQGTDAKLSAWTYRLTKRLDGFQVSDGEFNHYLRGHFLHETPGNHSRLDALRLMWADVDPLKGILIGGGLSILSAILFVPRKRRLYPIAATLFFFGVSLVFAATVPPFHGPDEPDHFLSYGRVTGQKRASKLALDFARRTHFARIKQDTSQTFHPMDVNVPLPKRWVRPSQEAVTQSYMHKRSPVTTFFWRHIYPQFSDAGVGTKIFYLRVFNISIVSAAILTLASSLFVFIGPTTSAVTITFLAAAPGLLGFVGYVSNYPFFIAEILLLLATAIALLMAQKRPYLWAFLASALIILAILISRVGFCTLPIAAACLWFRGVKDIGEKFEAKAWFRVFYVLFLPALVALGLGYLCESTWVFERINRSLTKVIPGAGLTTLMLAALVVCWLTIPLGSWLWSRFPGDLSRSAFKAIGVTVLLIALAGSFYSHWTFPNIEAEKSVGALRYAYLAVKIFLRDFGWAGPDFYISRSFWTGFGWLDVPFPGWFDRLVKFVPTLSLIFGLLVLSRTPGSSTGRTLAALAISAAATFVVLAVASHNVSFNLHGRYLLPFYLQYLTIVGLVLGCALDAQSEEKKRIASFALGGLLTYVVLINAYSATVILDRYFG